MLIVIGAIVVSLSNIQFRRILDSMIRPAIGSEELNKLVNLLLYSYECDVQGNNPLCAYEYISYF